MEKHLYAINITENKKNERADETPYRTAILSEETSRRRDETSQVFTKQLTKSLGLGQYIAAIVCIGLGVTVFMGFLGPLFSSFSTGETGALLASKWPILVGGAALLLVGVVLYILNKKRHEGADENPELDEAWNTQAGVARIIQAELGLPDEGHLTQIDVLPFRYKASGDKVKEVREHMMYEPACLFMWREGDALCITDHDALITVPLSDIESCTLEDVKFITNMWWKDDEPGEGAYADCGVKEDKSNFNYHVRGMGEVRIRHGEDAYLLRVPGYDFDLLRKLIGQ